MNRTAKIIFDTVTIIIIIVVVGFYFFLNQSFDRPFSKGVYNHLVEKVNESQDLPDRFYEIYGQVTGFNENSTTNTYLFHKIFSNKKKPCPCVDASRTFAHKNSDYITYRAVIDHWNIGIALDKDASPKKCLDYYLSSFDFLNNTVGIQNASRFHYQKELEQLSDDEMLELAVMTLNPTLYNKIRFPERLRKKVEEIKEEQ